MTRIQQLIALALEELETAELLLTNDRYRACVSRLYYALYHATQALLTSKNLDSKTHRGAIQLFGQHFIKTGELPIEMARTLSDTYDLRRLSDYDETVLLTQQQATQTLNATRVFVSTAQLYCS